MITQVFMPFPAKPANTATGMNPCDAYPIAFPKSGHLLPEGLDPAYDFVPEDNGKPWGDQPSFNLV
jgi:hypothetical protein